MVEAGCVGILVVGAPQVGKKSVIGRLVGALNASSDWQQWSFETKYYTASTYVASIPASSITGLQEYPALQAVVLVFDVRNEETFQAVKDFESTADTSNVDVKLCLANKADLISPTDSAMSPSWSVEAKEWCIQEQYEYVEVSAADEEFDKELAQSDEQQGMARVVDALQAHAWPGLVRKKLPQMPCMSIDAEQDQNTASEGLGPATTLQITERATEDSAFNLLDEDNEKAEDSVDKLFAEAAGIREQLQDMPDDKRRHAAANFALRLLEAFDINDDSDED